jgi:epoxide hydrolase-like protein
MTETRPRPTGPGAATQDSTIRPFQVEISQAALDDLRRRITATRWPSPELVNDRSQGVQLATTQALARSWASDYDWRRVEARLNALPQFLTTIDGVDLHFLHVRSPHEQALPLIMTHGWPGSVIELLDTVGDVGAAVTDAMGRQAPQGLIGIHTNLLVTVLAGPQPTESEQERAAADQLATFRESGFGYFLEMATRPQTIGYALLDSPLALAAWLLDHDTDSYDKISAAFVDGAPAGNLTQATILDNITLYWLTGTGASAARSYWEDGQALAQARASGQAPPPVSVPVGFTTFPGEIWRTPRSWVENSYPTLTYFNEADRGGHFAAWEEPQLFTEELRAAFQSLR